MATEHISEIRDTLSSRIGTYIETRVDGLLGSLEEGDVAPTSQARSSCRNLLQDAEALWISDDSIPFPTVTTAGDGDIFCQWVRGDKIVFIDVESTGVVRLFYSGLAGAGSDRTVGAPTAIDVRDALYRLADAEWMPTVGIFDGDPIMREVLEESREIRVAQRKG